MLKAFQDAFSTLMLVILALYLALFFAAAVGLLMAHAVLRYWP